MSSVSDKLHFATRKTIITIDYSRCEPARKGISQPSCGFACVKACRLYGRNILRIEGNRPVLAVSDAEEIKRLDNECMACEFHCDQSGPGCVSITVRLDVQQ